MQDKAISVIREELLARLSELRQDKTVTEPNPDWYNTHDWSSGLFRGRQTSVQTEINFLENLLDKLSRLC